jgi:hypothetical protein
MRTALLKSFLVITLLAGAARADVLVVDGLGVLLDHHATIQSAVDAAAPGDTVLVDATLDLSGDLVVVDGKGLSILTDTHDEDVIIRYLEVRNLPLGQDMVVRGLRVEDAPPGEAMVFEDNAGSLRLYDVHAKGVPGQEETATQNGRPGGTAALFTNCDDVLMRDSGFSGGDGADVGGAAGLDTSAGGIGGVVTDSRLTVYFGGFGGGRGGEVTVAVTTVEGADGGTGLIAQDSELFFYGAGGHGGYGGDANFTNAGDGGTGYIQQGATTARYVWDPSNGGGPGGDSTFGKDGLEGVDEVLSAGTTQDLSSSGTWARDIWVETPLREGEDVVISGTGFDDDFWIIIGFDPAHLLLPAYEGTFMIAPPLSDLIYLGHVPFLTTHFNLGPAPALPAGFDAVEVLVQAVMTVGGNGFMLGPADHVVVLSSTL